MEEAELGVAGLGVGGLTIIAEHQERTLPLKHKPLKLMNV
jgi:hypothetical protein